MRVLIAGCGSIGSMVGAFLRLAQHDVTLLGRGWHLDAVRASGLDVDGIWGEYHAQGFEIATHASQLVGTFDLVAICVKSYDTTAVVAEVAGLLAPDSVAISLQNGLGNVETLADQWGPERSFGASVLIGTRIDRPGTVTVTVQAAPIVLGPLIASPPALHRAEQVAETLRAASLPCEATDAVLPALWSKVFYNAALNPLGALLQVHYGALGDDPDLRWVMDQVLDEAFQVAQARGVALPWKSADAYRERFYTQLVPDTYVHRSSMLQDLERGRRTEIHAINGRISRYGAELGIPTPSNDLLTRLILWRERQGPTLGL